MQFQYKKYYLNNYLIIAAIWVILGLTYTYHGDPRDWVFYGWLVASIGNTTVFGYKFLKPYVSIDHNRLKVHEFLNSTSIRLSHETHVKKKGTNYTLVHADQKLTFNGHLLDDTSVKTLDATLRRFNVQWK